MLGPRSPAAGAAISSSLEPRGLGISLWQPSHVFYDMVIVKRRELGSGRDVRALFLQAYSASRLNGKTPIDQLYR